MNNYKIWARRVVEVARDLAPYEAARQAAIMHVPPPSNEPIEFVLKIFEKPRTPLALQQIEATAGPDSAIAPVAEVKTIATDVVAVDSTKQTDKPAGPAEKPAASPPAPPPEPNAYGTSHSGLSLFGPYGHPNFNQYRSVERYRDLYRR
jgi:hypothetical protein